MPLVPTVRTPLSPRDAEREIGAAWRRQFDRPMPAGALRNALALWDLETRAGRSQFNHNFGNQIAISDDLDFWQGDDSGNLRKFRSFRTRPRGASAFVRLLTRPSRRHWKRGLLSGDPTVFSRALKGDPTKNLAAYYEAPEPVYTRTLVGRWRKYSHLGGDSGLAYGALAVGVLAAFGAAYYYSRRRRAVRR